MRPDCAMSLTTDASFVKLLFYGKHYIMIEVIVRMLICMQETITMMKKINK